MSEKTRIGLIIICFVLTAFQCALGVYMRKRDFSSVFETPFAKEKGLYVNASRKPKKIAEDTPENRERLSKGLGTLVLCLSAVWAALGVLLLIFG